MKKKMMMVMLVCCFGGTVGKAQFPITEIIKAGIVKVIKAVDLAVQRLQNETIWLQNAQKTKENALSKIKLQEISGWVNKQRELYQSYFDELKQVKSVIANYQRVRHIASRQVQLVSEYKRAWRLFQQDSHFSPEEMLYMGKVYTGILDASLRNVEQVLLAVQSFAATMEDAERLNIIHAAADKVDEQYAHLKKFNRQNMLLSIQRSRDANEVKLMRKLYGL